VTDTSIKNADFELVIEQNRRQERAGFLPLETFFL
jgi:hypothetical protein